MSATVKVDIVGVGAFLKAVGSDRYRPYARGATVEVDAGKAERLIAHGVAVLEGEAPPEEDIAAEENAEPDAITGDYDSHSKADLEAEAKRRGIYESIDGTGADGNVVKDDLVAALEADDAG